MQHGILRRANAVARSSEKVRTTKRPGAATSTNDKYDEDRIDRLTAFLIKLDKTRNCFLSYVVASYSFKRDISAR